MAGGERIRLFCALCLPGGSLPGGSLERLAAWQRAELRGGRLVEPASLHVTLAFLGDRPRSEVQPIARELEAAAHTAGPVAFTAGRYRETGSVGMVTLDDIGGAGANLAGELARRLEQLGVYRGERRPWLPHITVLRFRERPGLAPDVPELGQIVPSDAAVYSSVLRSSGAQYEILESVALGGR